MAQTSVEQSELLEELDIFDAETHTGEKAQALIEYIDDEQVQQQERDGYDYQPDLTGPFGADGWDRSAGGKMEWSSGRQIERAEEMDERREELHIDRTLFNAGMGFQAYAIPKKAKRIHYMRATNNYIQDRFGREDDTNYTSILVVPDHPEESAAEIERYGDEDNVVAAFSNSFMDYGFGHERYEPVMEALDEYDLPLIFHGDSTNQPYFPAGFLRSNHFVEHHTLTHPMAHLRNIVHIIGQEIPERYDIDFGFWEAGQSWIQMAMNRMDREYIERIHDIPGLTKLPSEYMREFYYGTQPLEETHEPEHLQRIIEDNGLEDQLVFTSDWPHMDFDAPSSILDHDGLTQEQKKKILQDNAQELLDL
ncbi:amidohydrolase family protein [Haloglomus litoreum]|uniref:amidohydrolase family protein n=1 Tax=Haloglomus litoreum TaxID=3034026 RepID=UPI0023E826C2|nr:amidohydrolase family protein [Haloglomus sp. DT116]